VWSVVRDGLGESEEGIKDIFPLSFPHCFYLCLLELGGESLKERTKRSLEELEGESKEELGGENKGNHLSQLSTCKIQELKR
jgi:hypothetical protein